MDNNLSWSSEYQFIFHNTGFILRQEILLAGCNVETPCVR